MKACDAGQRISSEPRLRSATLSSDQFVVCWRPGESFVMQPVQSHGFTM
tara:strand:+ start:5799 stop:5945 length:147 start_codon:yes stop_codon:yes gene_type:complete